MSQRGGRIRPLRFLTLAVGVASILVAACSSSESTTQAVTTPAPQAPTTAPAAASPTAVVAGASTPSTGAAVPAAQIKGPYSGEAKSLDGAGATFPAPLYT